MEENASSVDNKNGFTKQKREKRNSTLKVFFSKIDDHSFDQKTIDEINSKLATPEDPEIRLINAMKPLVMALDRKSVSSVKKAFALFFGNSDFKFSSKKIKDALIEWGCISNSKPEESKSGGSKKVKNGKNASAKKSSKPVANAHANAPVQPGALQQKAGKEQQRQNDGNGGNEPKGMDPRDPDELF